MTRPDGTGRHFTAFAAATLVAAAAMAGCTTNASSGTASGTAAGSGSPTATAGNMAVQATDTSCGVSTATAPSGNLVFNVTNGGSKVTEFYLLASDGLRIVGEVENIGPGISRNLVVQAPPGSYFTACKPGMVGDGIRAAFIVTDSGADLTASGDDQQLVTTANTLYAGLFARPDRAARRRDQPVRQALRGRQGRRGPRALPDRACTLRADRACGRVVR